MLSASASRFVVARVFLCSETSATIATIAHIAATHVMKHFSTRELPPPRLRSSADNQDQGGGAAIDLRGLLLLDLGITVGARRALADLPSSASLACLDSPLFAHSRSQSALPASRLWCPNRRADALCSLPGADRSRTIGPRAGLTSAEQPTAIRRRREAQCFVWCELRFSGYLEAQAVGPRADGNKMFCVVACLC